MLLYRFAELGLVEMSTVLSSAVESKQAGSPGVLMRVTLYEHIILQTFFCDMSTDHNATLLFSVCSLELIEMPI